MRDVGMDYDRAVFGMKLSDCRSLTRCLEYCEALVRLDLSSNCLDDDKLRMLASGLVNNLSVVDISLADNRIADRGVRAFAKLLHVNSVIQIVDLGNNQVRPATPFAMPFLASAATEPPARVVLGNTNSALHADDIFLMRVVQIHSEGGRALARALRTNASICSLNLRLNRLGEEGGRAVFDVLREHPSLTSLNVAHNALGPAAAKSIAKFLGQNKALAELDISGNELGGKGGAAIREAVSGNGTLQHCEVALSGMTQSDCLEISDTLHARAEARARQRFTQLSA
jgi:Ran GTPase-activating protein (RanGAP) involved in mRNA processing and transport